MVLFMYILSILLQFWIIAPDFFYFISCLKVKDWFCKKNTWKNIYKKYLVLVLFSNAVILSHFEALSFASFVHSFPPKNVTWFASKINCAIPWRMASPPSWQCGLCKTDFLLIHFFICYYLLFFKELYLSKDVYCNFKHFGIHFYTIKKECDELVLWVLDLILI